MSGMINRKSALGNRKMLAAGVGDSDRTLEPVKTHYRSEIYVYLSSPGRLQLVQLQGFNLCRAAFGVKRNGKIIGRDDRSD